MTPMVFMRSNGRRPYEARLATEAMKPNVVILNKKPFDNYLLCEDQALTPVYAVVDDDIIPAHEDSIQKLCTYLEQHPEVGIMGLAWQPNLTEGAIEGWVRGKRFAPDLLNIDHVGGLIAIRRGILKDEGERPNFEEGIGDDMLLCRQFRKKGYGIALCTSDWFIHMGEGKSTIWTEAR